jgi:hypothetical protein
VDVDMGIAILVGNVWHIYTQLVLESYLYIIFFFLTQALSYQIKEEKTGSNTHVALWPKTDTPTHASNNSYEHPPR